MRHYLLDHPDLRLLRGVILRLLFSGLFLGSPVRLSRRRPLLLPALSARAEGVGRGRWPLWEPEENAGMPLLGNPTAAVLYPGKLIYAVLPYAWGARVYIVAHRCWPSWPCWS